MINIYDLYDIYSLRDKSKNSQIICEFFDENITNLAGFTHFQLQLNLFSIIP